MDAKLITVVVSLAVHGMVVALFAAPPDAERARIVLEEAPPPVVAVPTPEPPPVEIAFLDARDVASMRAVDPRVFGGRPRERISTGRRSSEPTTAPTTELPRTIEPPVTQEVPAIPKGTLKMRTGPDLPRVSTRLADEASGMSEVPVHVPDLPGARLDHELYKVEARLGDPSWVERADPAAVAAARLERQALREQRKQVELVEQKDGTYASDKDVFVAKVGRDGKVRFEDRPNVRIEGLSGRFDATDWLMRRQGMDPYASKKLAFMDRTRDQRVEIAKVHRREQLALSATHMQRNLERVWSTIPDVAGRKRAVFELWDECEETGDEHQLTATAEARQRLVSWVQTKLRGADAFTPDELARLNATRTSKAVFAP